jgi:hypothetical protein
MKSNPSSTGIDRRVLLSGLAVLPTLQVNLRNRPTLSRLSTNLHDRGCSFRISKEPCTEDDNRNEGAFPLRLVAVAAISVAAALAEHYLLEEFAPAKTRFTYRVAIEPRLAVAVGGPLSRMYFGSMFKSACENLQSFVLKART